MSSLRILPAFGLLCLLSLPAKATPTVHWTCSPSSTVDVGQQYTLTVTAVPGYGDTINGTILQRGGSGVASGPTVATYTHSETAGGSVTFTALIIFTNTQNQQYGVQYTSPSFTLTARPNHPPTIAWLSAPASATYGQQYYIQAQGQDVDGDLTTVNIYRNGQPFAFGYDPAGDGTPRGNKANSGNPDIAPSSLQTIEFKAVAIDARGNSSATIYCYVTILSPHAPVLDDTHFSIPYIFQTTDVVVNGHDVDGDMKLIGAWVDGDNPTSPTAAFPGVYNISHAVHHHQNPGPYVVTAAYWVDLWDWSDHETFLYSGQLITQNRVVGLPAITASRVDLTLGDSLNLTTAQHDADGNLTQHMMYYKWMPPGGSSYGEQQLLTAQQQYQNGVYDAAYQFVWTPTAAGTYQVYAYGTDPYSTAQSTPITVTVERLPNTVTFSLPTQSYVYGQPFNVNAYASSGLAVYYTTDPSSTGTATYSGTTGTATRAGSLTIWAHQDGDATYSPAQPVSQTVTIARATPTVTWAPPAAITYGAALSSTQLDATASVPGTFAYTPALGTVVGAGNRTLSVTFTPNDATNYASVTTTTSLLVNKASLTVTANNAGRVYGAANPALTYAVTGLVNGDSASVVTGVTVSTTAGTASAVGTYPITASGGSAANYNLAHAAGTLTVTRAGLTITANNATRAYGAANPTFTASYLGLLNGDTPAVVSGLSLATTATTGSNVGTYPITGSGASAANYAIGYAAGTLTITQAVPTLTWATPAAIWSDVALGSAQLNATATVPGSFSYSPAAGTLLTVGSHSLSVTFAPADTANYQSVTKTVVLTVMDAMADDDGDGLPNRWEVQLGLNPADASDASQLKPNGVSYLEDYNSWGQPLGADQPLHDLTQAKALVSVIAKVTGTTTGTVTITAKDGNGLVLASRTFNFQPSSLWSQDNYGGDDSLPVSCSSGGMRTISVTASANVVDFVVAAKLDPQTSPLLRAMVELNGSYTDRILKSELNAGSFSLRIVPGGQIPFGQMDDSEFDSARMILFGLGGSRSGQTAGRVLFSAGALCGPNDDTYQPHDPRQRSLRIIKGPALEWSHQANTHFQGRTASGYVDVLQTREHWTVQYFPQGAYPDGSGFNDFSAATPLATYDVALAPSRFTITRSVGGVTMMLEEQSEFKANLDNYVEPGGADPIEEYFTTVGTSHYWRWRTPGTPRQGLTKVVTTNLRLILIYGSGPISEYFPTSVEVTRYNGASEDDPVALYTKDWFGAGDFLLQSKDSEYLGVSGDTVRGNTWGSGGSPTLAIKPVGTTDSTGGGTYIEFYSLPTSIVYPGNLDGQPSIALGEKKSETRTFGDGAVNPTTTYSYWPDPVDGRAVAKEAVTMMGSTKIGDTTYAYTTGTFNGQPFVTTTATAFINATDSMVSVSKDYSRRLTNLDLQGKPISIRKPDGTKTSYAYQRGTLSSSGTWSYSPSGPHLLMAEITGKAGTTISSYNPVTNDTTSGASNVAIDPLDMDPGRSTVIQTVMDAQGHVLRNASYVYTDGGGFSLLTATYSSYDSLGHLILKTDQANGAGRVLYQATYSGWRKLAEADEQGITLTYTYDDYDRVETVTRAAASVAGSTIAENTTTYTYDITTGLVDGRGRIVRQTVSSPDTTETLVTETATNTAGKVVKTTAPGGLVTSTEYTSQTNPASYYLTQTKITLPGGGTKIIVPYRDGRTKSITGTAVPDGSTTYSFDASGNLNTVQTTGGVTTTTVADWLGRTTSVTTATWDGGTRTVSNTYDSAGHLARQDTKSGAVTLAPAHLYSYDAYGRLDREALDANANGVIDPGTDYNVKQYMFAYQLGLGTIDTVNWYRYETQLVWPYDGAHSAASLSAYQRYEQVSGLTAVTAAHTVAFDFDRNLTETVTAIDRANRLRTIATTTSGTSQTLSQTFLNGLPIESTNAQGQTTLQTYDALGRLKTTDDPRTGATTYAYQDGTTLVASVTAPDGEETQYGYDTAGRVATQIDPAGKQAYYQYDAAGNLTHQWGDTVSPVRYEYNALGQRTVQHTYRSGTWTDATLPAGFANAGDVTTWTYQAATGLLTAKTDAKGGATHYEYNALGQKSKRTDARGWVTNYTYNAQTLPATVDYTGTAATVTTDLGYTYDREGKVKTVTDAAGTRTFSYYESWTDDSYEAELRNKSGRLQSETLPAFLGGHTLTYDYQYGVSGRANGAASGLQLDTGSLYSVAYGYDAVLRPGSVTYNGGTPWVYSYVANANLIDTVSQTGGYFRDYDYLSDSNRLDQMKHQWGTSSASAVETRVTYDPSSRLRNTEKTQGTAWMSVLGRSGESGVHTDYSYTDRYELTSSGKYLLNADWSVGAAAAGTARDYAFDPMGNRTSDQTGSYTPNELNQYTATPTAATLTYDANGNLTNDGVATYAYDAENRLITMNRDHGASSHYTYDYLGRRIRRTATGMTTQRYLYDGWNLIAELDDSGTITRQFIWGLDVSGSTQGAGGVGGLLEIDAGGTSQYYPIYDASHNVIGLYSGTGAIAAAYEYDPFGNKQTGLGTYAAANPFRFSTKYTDPDSGLVYYGMRYYSAKLGRFLNQDPIEEAGGINLYAFCGNDGVNRFDLLGMDGGFFDWLGSIFGGGSSSSSSRPPDIPGDYADATVRLPEITVGGGGNPGQSGDVSSAGDSSHYDAIKSYQDGRTIDDVNASMRSNDGIQSLALSSASILNPIKDTNGNNLYFYDGKWAASDAYTSGNHVETDGKGGLTVKITETAQWVLSNPAIMASIVLHEATHIEHALANDPNMGMNLPAGLIIGGIGRIRIQSEIGATLRQLEYINAVIALPAGNSFITPRQSSDLGYYRDHLVLPYLQHWESGTPMPYSIAPPKNG